MRLPSSFSVFLVALMLAFGNTLLGQDTSKEKAIKQALEKLEGEWKLVRCESDGAMLDIGAAKLVIKGNSYVLDIGPGTDKGTFSVDPVGKIATCDLHSKPSDEKNLAVYDLNGNQLRLAYRMDNKRASSALGKRGNDEGHVLYVFERGDGKLELERSDKLPKIPKVVVAAEKTPFRQELKLKKGECWIVVLPNKKEVILWAEKDRLGLAKTKSGLNCTWEHDTHIKQGSVIYKDKTIEHELFVGDWQLSFVDDLTSLPHLTVTVIVTERAKKDK